MKTAPNQKIVTIHRNKPKDNFLMVAKEDLYTASKELTAAEFKLYLYLTGNKDGFDLALSQVAFANAMGIKKTAYYTAVNGLQEKGYLSHRKGNHYDFYDRPRQVQQTEGDRVPPPQNEQKCSPNGAPGLENGQEHPRSDREINNINNINKRDKSPVSPDLRQSNDKRYREEIETYLRPIAFEPKVQEGKERLLALIEQEKRSAEWVCTALEAKKEAEWSKYGFGLITGTNPNCLSFQKQIDGKVADMEAKRARIAKSAKTAKLTTEIRYVSGAISEPLKKIKEINMNEV